MNLILTMAGKYERFKLFGNKVPKYLMPLGKTTVLWHVLYELLRFNSELKVYLLANDTDRDFQPVIKSIMDDFSINLECLSFVLDTKSQLETALSISSQFETNFTKSNLPLAFTNIDTIMKRRSGFFGKLSKLEKKQGLIDSFIGSSHEYSYLLHNNNGEVIQIADGSRLSDYACSGLYGFSSGEFFCFEAKELLEKQTDGNFTSLYQALVKKGFTIQSYNNLDSRDTLVLGTPEEYISNIHRF